MFSSNGFADPVIAVQNIFTIYPQHFSIPEISETLKDSPTKSFGTVRQNIFNGKSWYTPPLLSMNFLVTENFLKRSTEGFPYQFFRHCETKNFRRKLLIPPLLFINFFATGRNFSETRHRRVPLTKFFGPVRQKSFGKTVMPPPPPMHENFRYKSVFETQKGSPTKFFGTVRQKFLTQNPDIPFSGKKLFR